MNLSLIMTEGFGNGFNPSRSVLLSSSSHSVAVIVLLMYLLSLYCCFSHIGAFEGLYKELEHNNVTVENFNAPSCFAEHVNAFCLSEVHFKTL